MKQPEIPHTRKPLPHQADRGDVNRSQKSRKRWPLLETGKTLSETQKEGERDQFSFLPQSPPFQTDLVES